MKQEQKKQKSSKVTIGLDLGDRRHRFCVLGAAGEVIEEGAMRNDRVSFGQVAHRCGAHWRCWKHAATIPFISRFLEKEGCRVLIANPGKWTVLPKPSPNGSTTQPRK